MERALSLDEEFVKACWKMCGLKCLSNTPDEAEQIAVAIANMNVSSDDEYESCSDDETEPDRVRDDDLIELVPVPNESLPDPEQVADRKKTQTTITNYFKTKTE